MGPIVNQEQTGQSGSNDTTHTWSFVPKAGNLLYIVSSRRDGGIPGSVSAGWTLVQTVQGGVVGLSGKSWGIAAKVSDGTETSMTFFGWSGGDPTKQLSDVVEIAGYKLAGSISGAATDDPGSTTYTWSPIALPAGKGYILMAYAVQRNGGVPVRTPGAGFVKLWDTLVAAEFHPCVFLQYRELAGTGAGVGASATSTIGDGWETALLAFEAQPGRAFVGEPGGGVW